MRSFLFLILAVFISGSVLAQSSASDTFVGKIKVWGAISVACIADFAFPDIVANVAYADGSIKTDSAAQVPGGGLGHNLDCTVNGEPSRKYRLSISPSANVPFNGDSDLYVVSFGTSTGYRTLSAGGSDLPSIQAKLGGIAANAVSTPGDYETDPITITVEYYNW